MGMANGKDKTYYEMTPEQALDKLDKTVIGDLELKIVLTKALEKQIARKPKKDEYGFLHCPCCDYDDYSLMHDSNFADRYNHCHHCGQKLDWEER